MSLPVEVADRVNTTDCALLVIDMQRRHLDVDGVGYHVLPAERARSVTSNAGVAIDTARAVEMPIIHVATWMKPATPWGSRSGRNPFFEWQNGKPITGANFVRQANRCTEGSVYAEFMPETTPLPHEPVVVKFRYSGFYMTDLELVLRGLGIRTILIAGVNTNNCVLHTAFDAHARDIAVVALSDACGSMNGDEFHEIALRQIGASIGWISSVAEFGSLVEPAVGDRRQAATGSTD